MVKFNMVYMILRLVAVFTFSSYWKCYSTDDCNIAKRFVDCRMETNINSLWKMGRVYIENNSLIYQQYDVNSRCSERELSEKYFLSFSSPNGQLTTLIGETQFLSGQVYGEISHDQSTVNIKILSNITSAINLWEFPDMGNSTMILCHPDYQLPCPDVAHNVSLSNQIEEEPTLVKCVCGWEISNNLSSYSHYNGSAVPNSTIDQMFCVQRSCTEFNETSSALIMGGVYTCTASHFPRIEDNPITPKYPDIPTAPVSATWSVDGSALLIDFTSSLLIPSEWLGGDDEVAQTVRKELLAEWGWVEGIYVGDNASPYVDCSCVFSVDTMQLLTRPLSSPEETTRVMRPLCHWTDVPPIEIKHDAVRADKIHAVRDEEVPTRLVVFVPSGARITESDVISLTFELTYEESYPSSPADHPVDNYYVTPSENRLAQLVANTWRRHADAYTLAILDLNMWNGNQSNQSIDIAWSLEVVTSTKSPSQAPSSVPSVEPSSTPTHVPSSLSVLNYTTSANRNNGTKLNETRSEDTDISYNTSFTAANTTPNATASQQDDDIQQGLDGGAPGSDHIARKSVAVYYSLTVAGSDNTAASPDKYNNSLRNDSSSSRKGYSVSSEVNIMLRAPQFIYSPCLRLPCASESGLDTSPGLILDASATHGQTLHSLIFTWHVRSITRFNCSQYDAPVHRYIGQDDTALQIMFDNLQMFINNSLQVGEDVSGVDRKRGDMLNIPLQKLLACSRVTFELTVTSQKRAVMTDEKNLFVDVVVLPIPIPTVTIDGSYASCSGRLNGSSTTTGDSDGSERGSDKANAWTVDIPLSSQSLPFVLKLSSTELRSSVPLTIGHTLTINPLTPQHIQPIVDIPPAMSPLSQHLRYTWELYKIQQHIGRPSSPMQGSIPSLVMTSYDRTFAIPVALVRCVYKTRDAMSHQQLGCHNVSYRFFVLLNVHAGNYSSTESHHFPQQSFFAAEVITRDSASVLSPVARIVGGSRCAHYHRDIVLDGNRSTLYKGGAGLNPHTADSNHVLAYKWSCWFVNSDALDAFQRSSTVLLNQQCTGENVFRSITHDISQNDITRTEDRAKLDVDGCRGYSMFTQHMEKTEIVNTVRAQLNIPRNTLQAGSTYKICLDVSTQPGIENIPNGSISESSRYCVGVYVIIPETPDTGTSYSESSSTRQSNPTPDDLTWSPLSISAPFVPADSAVCVRNSGGAQNPPSCSNSIGYWMNSEHPLRLVATETSGQRGAGNPKNSASGPLQFPYPLCKASGSIDSSQILYSYPNTSWSVLQIMPKLFQMRRRMVPGSDGRYQGVHIVSMSEGMYQMSYPHFAFTPGASMSISHSAKCPDNGQEFSGSRQRGRAHITVGVRSPPRHGYLSVSPRQAVSLESTLSLRQSDWLGALDDSDALPLQYSFYYSVGKITKARHGLPKFSPAVAGIDTMGPSMTSALVAITAGDMCLREWMQVPHTQVITPFVMNKASVSASNSSGMDNSNDAHSPLKMTETVGSNTTSCSNMSVAGFVQDMYGSLSVRRTFVLVCPRIAVSDVVSGYNSSSAVDEMIGNYHARYATETVRDAVVDSMYMKDFVRSAVLQNALASLLNAFKVNLSNATHMGERRAARQKLLRMSVFTSMWTTRESIVYEPEWRLMTAPLQPTIIRTPTSLYPDLFGYALRETVLYANELNEASKSQVLPIVQNLVEVYLSQSTPAAAYDGYASSETCTSVFYSLHGLFVEYLLQSLDRSGPLTNYTFATLSEGIASTGKRVHIAYKAERIAAYKQSLLGMKRILMGCLLSGESTGRGVMFAAVLTRGQPTDTLHNITSDDIITFNGTNATDINATFWTNVTNTSAEGNRSEVMYRGRRDLSLTDGNTTGNATSDEYTIFWNQSDMNSTIWSDDGNITEGAASNFSAKYNHTSINTTTNSSLSNSTSAHFPPLPPQSPGSDNYAGYVVNVRSITPIETLLFGGSQIAASRQSTFLGLSDASVALGQDTSGAATTITTTARMDSLALSSLSSESTQPSDGAPTDNEVSLLSFLKLPCDSTDSMFQISTSTSTSPVATCEDNYQTLSRSSRRLVSVKDAILSTTGAEGYVDISIINVAQFLVDSDDDDTDENVAADEIRSWIPHVDSDQGASDAVVVEIKVYSKGVQAIYNISQSIEVSLKVSRSDVFWKLVTTAPVRKIEEKTAHDDFIVLKKFEQFNSEYDNVESTSMTPLMGAASPPATIWDKDESPISASNISSNTSTTTATTNMDVIFTPRWVRCEMYDEATENWDQPPWLDGWWSPDVVSFATDKELNEAALYHRSGVDIHHRSLAEYYSVRSSSLLPSSSLSSSPTTSDAARNSLYLVLNTSLEVLPSSLSCFVNALYLGQDEPKSMWLQWRVVTFSSDPCGGCSGHGVCVLFRTTPVCLCDEEFTGRFCETSIGKINATSTGNQQWRLHRSITRGGLTGMLTLFSIFSICVVVFIVGNKLYFATQSTTTRGRALYDPSHAYETTSDMTAAAVIPSHMDRPASDQWMVMATMTSEERSCGIEVESSSEDTGNHSFSSSDFEGSVFYTSASGDIISTMRRATRSTRGRKCDTSSSVTTAGDMDDRVSLWGRLMGRTVYVGNYVLGYARGMRRHYSRAPFKFDDDDEFYNIDSSGRVEELADSEGEEMESEKDDCSPPQSLVISSCITAVSNDGPGSTGDRVGSGANSPARRQHLQSVAAEQMCERGNADYDYQSWYYSHECGFGHGSDEHAAFSSSEARITAPMEGSNSPWYEGNAAASGGSRIITNQSSVLEKVVASRDHGLRQRRQNN